MWLKHLELWSKVSADDILKKKSYFSQKTDFVISYNLSPWEIICMKFETCFLGKVNKNIIILSSDEIAQKVLKFKLIHQFS